MTNNQWLWAMCYNIPHIVFSDDHFDPIFFTNHFINITTKRKQTNRLKTHLQNFMTRSSRRERRDTQVDTLIRRIKQLRLQEIRRDLPSCVSFFYSTESIFNCQSRTIESWRQFFNGQWIQEFREKNLTMLTTGSLMWLFLRNLLPFLLLVSVTDMEMTWNASKRAHEIRLKKIRWDSTE